MSRLYMAVMLTQIHCKGHCFAVRRARQREAGWVTSGHLAAEKTRKGGKGGGGVLILTRFFSSSSFLCFWKGVSFFPTENDNPPTMLPAPARSSCFRLTAVSNGHHLAFSPSRRPGHEHGQ